MSAVTLLPGAEVVSLDEGAIHTRVTIDPAAPVFAGHYPHFPLLPGVFTLDAVDHAVRLHAERIGGVRTELAEVRSVRFASPVFPGDVLTVECVIKTVADGGRDVKVRCHTDREKTATLRLRYRDSG
ncbi:3-hydroxyacyl-ACP dehydratase FabZ family protein [Streptomyces zagrosensis]|uniref:3-hydroxyacyl-[acyl-carrier-protein] dehydratase n=1 Tax=Streptomyces zagrosensis TaxID=1042984 RepID=A0A7W9QI57_9ACTN|nr:MaoC/PaaZ C-terminal domain-containing protein [Streptomyces zagrosensis]MBB5940153.1 3-hydroxyacyl-[acyl-carrier-protein] dehydratase [Streptomyces zagrosensis]